MPPKKNNQKKSKKQNKQNAEEDFSLEEILFVGESYCMACDSPLRSYSSLICPECLEESAEAFSTIISSQEIESPIKTIFIDLDFKPNSSEEDIEESEEVFEQEDHLLYDEDSND